MRFGVGREVESLAAILADGPPVIDHPLAVGAHLSPSALFSVTLPRNGTIGRVFGFYNSQQSLDIPSYNKDATKQYNEQENFETAGQNNYLNISPGPWLWLRAYDLGSGY